MRRVHLASCPYILSTSQEKFVETPPQTCQLSKALDEEIRPLFFGLHNRPSSLSPTPIVQHIRLEIANSNMSSDKKSDDFVVRLPERNDSFQEEKDPFLARTPSQRVSPPALHDKFAKVQNNPGISILCYCLSSISMTVVNKYCVSGKNWNLNLFYLAIQV